MFLSFIFRLKLSLIIEELKKNKYYHDFVLMVLAFVGLYSFYRLWTF